MRSELMREQAVEALRRAAEILENDERMTLMPGYDDAYEPNALMEICEAAQAIIDEDDVKISVVSIGRLVRYIAEMLEE